MQTFWKWLIAELGDSRVLERYAQVITFDLEVFKVILGYFGELTIFRENDFQNATPAAVRFMLLSNKPFTGVPCDSPDKSNFLEF